METRLCVRERKRELEIERANWRGKERFGDPDESRDYLFLWGSEREREGGRQRQTAALHADSLVRTAPI